MHYLHSDTCTHTDKVLSRKALLVKKSSNLKAEFNQFPSCTAAAMNARQKGKGQAKGILLVSIDGCKLSKGLNSRIYTDI